MIGFEIEEIAFNEESLRSHPDPTGRLRNWPAVYTINNKQEIYIGETGSAVNRMLQHKRNDAKKDLEVARILLDDSFHRSACYDLESLLIQWAFSDGSFTVLNGNDGHRNEEYAGRREFQPRFREIFEQLRDRGVFANSLTQIENSDFFKLSPFKALTLDQESAVVEILKVVFESAEKQKKATTVIAGNPGTGKTIVGISLVKTLCDISRASGVEDAEQGSPISDFFAEGYPEHLRNLKIGLVVPQQSLRKSIGKIFDRAPGLDRSMLMTPFQVGDSDEQFDILVVDEAHRLNQRSNQPSGVQNAKFISINEKLFGADSTEYSQLDWIRTKSRHTILLMDADQTVRPHDLPPEVVGEVVGEAKAGDQYFPLRTQMRVRAESDYVGYVKRLLDGSAEPPPDFGDYEFRVFDNVADMEKLIRKRDATYGLSRLASGYAWPWISKGSKKLPESQRPFDIEIDGRKWRWNSTDVDWVNSPGSLEEVGSIHTLQGYDLNYAGVIIGKDLYFDEKAGKIRFDRSNYFDKKGMENNRQRGLAYSDEDIERYVKNIYAVLMTRGIRGTYLYACDKALRQYLAGATCQH